MVIQFYDNYFCTKPNDFVMNIQTEKLSLIEWIYKLQIIHSTYAILRLQLTIKPYSAKKSRKYLNLKSRLFKKLSNIQAHKACATQKWSFIQTHKAHWAIRWSNLQT